MFFPILIILSVIILMAFVYGKHEGWNDVRMNVIKFAAMLVCAVWGAMVAYLIYAIFAPNVF